MYKSITILIFSLFSISSFSQNNDTNKEILKINERIDSFNFSESNKINVLEKLVLLKSDSLEKELLFYKVKEDFYSTALSVQATRFSLIMSGILALFALISFGAFKYEVFIIRKETNKKLKKHKKEIKQYKTQLLEIATDLKGAKGNLSTSIARLFEKESNFPNAFFYYIAAAKGHGESSKEQNNLKNSTETKYFTCLTNIKLAMKCLEKIESAEDMERLKGKLNITQGFMDDISKIDNVEVKNKIAEVRVKSFKMTE